MIGGAAHTIVKIPDNCGRGPYARIASLTPHPNQDILPPYHQSQKPATEQVYSLKFYYSGEALDFAAIPASNGPIYMRADVTDLPDYWDIVVESPPERKRWLKERGLEKRGLEQHDDSGEGYLGVPEFPLVGHMDHLLQGSCVPSRYGFHLQATVVPPSAADAKAHGQFTLEGEAVAQYDSSNIQFASFGFPGLY
ncbi:hypothetical protein B0H14DRAFT_3631208 [Mycena olivaceomarginata]|nr:hypothetical protein B0H14DRAFT_3631208 [Mycena olivaceomarginata]